MFHLEEYAPQRAFNGGLPAATTARPIVVADVGHQ
jgi:hypothetical protein